MYTISICKVTNMKKIGKFIQKHIEIKFKSDTIKIVE